MPQVETSEGLFYAANLGVVDITQRLLAKYIVLGHECLGDKADALIEET